MSAALFLPGLLRSDGVELTVLTEFGTPGAGKRIRILENAPAVRMNAGLNDVLVVVPIERIALDNLAPCEQLSSALR
jgi:hypothetical protein